jgi:desulfoferrodoxin-like iron-binding protein
MATKVGQKYRCNICGNEVVVTNAGAGELVCCGQPMVHAVEGFQCK